VFPAAAVTFLGGDGELLSSGMAAGSIGFSVGDSNYHHRLRIRYLLSLLIPEVLPPKGLKSFSCQTLRNGAVTILF
jgi:hypothetical protein